VGNFVGGFVLVSNTGAFVSKNDEKNVNFSPLRNPFPPIECSGEYF
jgi:hypothetical protein